MDENSIKTSSVNQIIRKDLIDGDSNLYKARLARSMVILLLRLRI